MVDMKLGKMLWDLNITVEQIRNEYKATEERPMCVWLTSKGLSEQDAVDSLEKYLEENTVDLSKATWVE